MKDLIVDVEILHPSELEARDIVSWRHMIAAQPAFASPLMGPEFAQAVGAVRPDARVAIWRREGRPVGFLAHHLRPSGLARPIGAPLSDYHTLVAGEPFDARAALAEAGLGALRFSGLVDPLSMFAEGAHTTHEAYVIELKGGAEAYLEALRAQSAKRFKNYRRLEHKIERELGALSVVAPDHDLVAFDQIIAWKREQLTRTGMHDFLAPAWTSQLMRNLFATRGDDFQGLMITLRIDGHMVAGHFGVRQGAVYHPWIASTDPEMGAYSIGQLFLIKAIAAMPDLGLTTYDLGPGHDHYKAPYALQRRTINEGTLTAAGPSGWRVRLGDGAWRMAGASGGPLVGRVRRRFETISDVELTLGGRVRGMAAAVASKGRRSGAASEG